MALTTLAFVVGYVVSVLLTLRKPYIGIPLYISVALLNPAARWWGGGLGIGMRWDFYAAIILVASFVLNRQHMERREKAGGAPDLWLLAFAFIVVITAQIAVIQQPAVGQKVGDILKRIGFYFLMTRVIATRKQYDIVIWAILLGCFWTGWETFRYGGLEGGRMENFSLGGAGGSNGIAMVLATCLPLLAYRALEGKRWEKIVCLFISPFILNGIILCNSRGATLGMAAGAALLLLLSPGRTRLRLIPVFIIGALLFVRLADERFLNRTKTIYAAEEGEDNSAGRRDIWPAAVLMMGDYPMGVGPSNFPRLSPEYLVRLGKWPFPNDGRLGPDTHNVYLLVGTEEGIPGLIVFIALILSVFWRLVAICLCPAEDEEGERFHRDAVAVGVSFVTFLVCAIFGNYLYVEIFYWLIALSVILGNMQRYPLVQAEEEEPVAPLPRPLVTAARSRGAV